jgi:hypothetical protein
MVGSGAPSVIDPDRDPSFPVRLFLNFLGGSLGRAPAAGGIPLPRTFHGHGFHIISVSNQHGETG